MKLSTFLPTLLSVFLVIILFCTLSLYFLPDIVPTGMKQVEDAPVYFDSSRDTMEFNTLKVSYDFPLFHPFISQFFKVLSIPLLLKPEKN